MRRRTPLRQIAAVAHESGEKVSEKSYHTHRGTESGHEAVPEEHSSPIQRRTLPPHTFPPAYAWSIGHKKWNLLRRIEHGNTTTTPAVAHALRNGHKIAVWWADKSRWYTAKVIDTTVQRDTQHTLRYDSDKSKHYTHSLMRLPYQKAGGAYMRWAPAPPTYTPPCPHCGGTTRGGTGSSNERQTLLYL